MSGPLQKTAPGMDLCFGNSVHLCLTRLLLPGTPRNTRRRPSSIKSSNASRQSSPTLCLLILVGGPNSCNRQVDDCGEGAEIGYSSDHAPEASEPLHEVYDTALIDGTDADWVGSNFSVNCTLYLGKSLSWSFASHKLAAASYGLPRNGRGVRPPPENSWKLPPYRPLGRVAFFPPHVRPFPRTHPSHEERALSKAAAYRCFCPLP